MSSYREALKIKETRETLHSKLQMNRHFALDVTPWFDGTPAQRTKIKRLLRDLQRALDDVPDSESRVRLVIGDEAVTRARFNAMLKDLKLEGLGSRAPPLLAAEDEKVLVGGLISAEHVAEELGGRLDDVYTLSRETWDAGNLASVVNFLIVLTGGLVYDATLQIERDIETQFLVRIQA